MQLACSADTRQSGISLAEALIALALAVLAVNVAIPYLPARDRPLGARQAANAIATELRVARNAAVASGREHLYVVDTARHLLLLAPGRTLALLPGLRVSIVTASVEQISQTAGGFRFYPDGSSTGGAVRIEDGTNREHFRIDIDWLSGVVRVTGSGDDR